MLPAHLFPKRGEIFAVWHQWLPLRAAGLTDGGEQSRAASGAQAEGQLPPFLRRRHFYCVTGPGTVKSCLVHQSGTSPPPLFPSGGLKRPSELVLHDGLPAAEGWALLPWCLAFSWHFAGGSRLSGLKVK